MLRNRLLAAATLAIPLLAAASPAACGASTCEELATQQAASHGSLTVTTGKSQTTALDDSNGLEIAAEGPTGLIIYGSTGSQATPDLSVYLAGVSAGENRELGAGSKICLASVPECLPLSGTLSASTFATECHAEGGCALTMTGTLAGTATWSGGSARLSLSIAHAETWESQACPSGHAPPATEGS